jgi:hypothetical protein
MANAVTLEFRATVSFIFEGIPHHATGAWQTSKKTAQRDAAERVLVMLNEQSCISSPSAQTELFCSAEASPVDQLSDYCAKLRGKQKTEALWETLCWSCTQENEGWQAAVEVCIYGDAVHTLQGAVCSNKQSAMEDTATRALWYLKAPSHLSAFEVSHEEVAQEALEVPSSEIWLREGMVHGADLYRSEKQQQAAEQKTTLMREQNRLQKRYARGLATGEPVWTWFYDYSPITEENPTGSVVPWCRATVCITGPNIEFQGQWCRGQKQAQLNACAHVTEYLDSEERGDSRR